MYEALDLARRDIIKLLWTNANVEGLGISFPRIEAILNGTPILASKGEMLFLINMKRTWEFLFENISYPNNLMFLRELHKICMSGLLYETGTIRKLDVSIGGTTWKPVIPQEAEIVDGLKNITDPIKLFCFIARGQFFLDGNKRLAQLMANKILIQNNDGIFRILPENLLEFKKLLLDFYETNNDEALYSFLQDKCIVRVRKSCR